MLAMATASTVTAIQPALDPCNVMARASVNANQVLPEKSATVAMPTITILEIMDVPHVIAILRDPWIILRLVILSLVFVSAKITLRERTVGIVNLDSSTWIWITVLGAPLASAMDTRRSAVAQTHMDLYPFFRVSISTLKSGQHRIRRALG